MRTGDFQIRPVRDDERERLEQFWIAHWSAAVMASRGKLYHARDFPGLVAEDERGEWVGLVTYRIQGDECEVMSLDSLREGTGIGTALLDAVVALVREAGVRRAWLITTNDNMYALRFYQRRGWRLAALYPNAVARSRRLKPQIPQTGFDGIPIRDEIELELVLEE